MQTFLQRCSFAIATTAGALLALYIAFAADLERPYWAVFSVFIIAAPIAGAVRSKAVWRLVGTVVGATAALILVPPLVQSPPLLCLAMAAWIAVCLGLSILDRSPRSYAPMLAGYTATIVGLAVVDVPQAIFDNAIARVEEIGVGIFCGALVHSVFFPRTVADELNGKISAAIRFAAENIARTLRDPIDEARHLDTSRQLTQMLADLHTLHAHIAFELSDVPNIGNHLLVVQRRLTALLPAMTSAQLAIEELRATVGSPAPLNDFIEHTARWADEVAHARDVLDDAIAPPIEPDASNEPLPSSPAWTLLLEKTATRQLQALIAALEDCRTLARAIRDGSRLPTELENDVRTTRPFPLYRDYTLAALSAGAAAVAVIIACVLWIAMAWPEGSIAAQFAAIGCSFFATLDRPSKMLSATLCAVLLAVPVAAVYQFALLPQIADFTRLALALTPILLVFSLLQSVPKIAGVGLIMAITFAGGLAFQEMYNPDFAAFLNITLAEIVGVLFAIAINLVLRTIDPAWNALRLARAASDAMRKLASGKYQNSHPHALLVDCLGQAAAREQLVDNETRKHLRSTLMRDLRIGETLAALNEAERTCHPEIAPPLASVRRWIGSLYEHRARSDPAPGSVDGSLDAGIATLATLPRSECRDKALCGLVALRIDLAPRTGLRPMQGATA